MNRFLFGRHFAGTECSRVLFMPSSRCTRFRLLADLPLDVAFKSITYRLAVAEVPVSGLWQLRATWPGGYWLYVYPAARNQ